MTYQKTFCVACAAMLLLSSCAAPGGSPDNSESSNATAIRCAALGIGGALFGAAIGGKGGAVKGAVAGLAACAIIEVASRQTRSSGEVEQQYRSGNRNQLPSRAKVDAYTTTVTPNGAVKAGEAINVHSTIRAVSGVNDPVNEIKEVLVAYTPDGEEFKRGEKKVNEIAGSGEYANSFTLKLPSSAPQGIYRLQTQVFLNGKPVSTRDSKVQVAVINGETQTIALLNR